VTGPAEAFASDGIVVLPGFFSAAECAGANAFLDRCEAEAPRRSLRASADYAERFDTRVKSWTKIDDEPTLALTNHPRLDAVTRTVLGEGGEQIYGTFAFGTPRDCGQGWHQDTAEAAPDQFCLNRLVYPRAVDLAQGALWYVPRSFRRDLPAGENEGDIEGQVALAPVAGTVVLMHSRCFHRVGRNHSDRLRLMLNCRVQPAAARADLTDFARFRTGTWQHSAAAPW
jgi:ectoine hydroxylase-related dioxygenase (phytanoyl-CoA dioxygenase family)